MGQKNEQEMILAAIRRKKTLYKKNLNLKGLSDEMKQQLEEDIGILNEEEQKVLGQMKI